MKEEITTDTTEMQRGVKNYYKELYARGSGEGTVRRGDYRNYYKGHMDKTMGEGEEGGWRWVHMGWGGGMGRKGIQL